MKNSLQITSQKNIVVTLILLCGVWRDITVMFIFASLTRWKSSFGSLVGLGLKSAYASLWVWGCLAASFVLASQIVLQKRMYFAFNVFTAVAYRLWNEQPSSRSTGTIL